jgi:hypothetical protein
VPPVPPTTTVSVPQRAAATDAGTTPLTADASTGPMPADRPDAR